jgi:hypothetical protein
LLYLTYAPRLASPKHRGAKTSVAQTCRQFYAEAGESKRLKVRGAPTRQNKRACTGAVPKIGRPQLTGKEHEKLSIKH